MSPSGSNGAAPRPIVAGGSVAGLFLALRRAEHAVTRRFAQVLAAEGCDVDTWRALSLLADGKGHAMAELAEATLLPGASMTRLVDRLVADNLVYRRADDQDRRRVLVYATERGVALEERLARRLDEEEGAVLADATPREAARMIGLLARLH